MNPKIVVTTDLNGCAGNLLINATEVFAIRISKRINIVTNNKKTFHNIILIDGWLQSDDERLSAKRRITKRKTK